MKEVWKPSTLLNPVPVVMVTCKDDENKPNIITIAWAGTVNSNPPMVSISVRPERHSYKMIENSGEFVINLVTEEIVKAADYCGVKSGKEVDKFKECNLTCEDSNVVSAPCIKESPVNLECVVKQKIELGSHTMFLAEVVSIKVDNKYLDNENKLCLESSDLVCYSHGTYMSLGECLGYFGYSLTKEEDVFEKRMEKLKKNRRKK